MKKKHIIKLANNFLEKRGNQVVSVSKKRIHGITVNVVEYSDGTKILVHKGNYFTKKGIKEAESVFTEEMIMPFTKDTVPVAKEEGIYSLTMERCLDNGIGMSSPDSDFTYYYFNSFSKAVSFAKELNNNIIGFNRNGDEYSTGWMNSELYTITKLKIIS